MYATAVAYLLNALSVYATDNQVVEFKEIIVDVSARNYNDFDTNIYSTGTLKSTSDSPYVFKGSISEIRQWSAIRFKVNSGSEDTGISYGFNTQADFDKLPDNVTLTKGLSGNAFYRGASTTLPVNVVATLSADQSSLDVKFITPAPVSTVIDGVQYTMCDDLNEFSGSKIDLGQTLSVEEGGSTSISIKIGDKWKTQA